jgi:hypothetical protein
MWPAWVGIANQKSKPGAPLTYLAATGLLFGTDTSGGVIYAYGSPTTNWNTGWQTVSQGATLQGSPITAVPFGTAGDIGVFLTDPNAGVYVVWGNHQVGWGDWAPVHWGNAKPGSPVNVMPYGQGIARFMADSGGGVWTSVGSPVTGFNAWLNVDQGATTPGSLVAALSLPSNRFSLFLTDPNGGVYGATGSPDEGWGIGWVNVPQVKAPPGSPISVVGGEQFMSLQPMISGRRQGYPTLDYWPQPTAVPSGPFKVFPGTPVTAINVFLGNSYGTALFVTGIDGSVWTLVGVNPDPQGPLTQPV